MPMLRKVKSYFGVRFSAILCVFCANLSLITLTTQCVLSPSLVYAQSSSEEELKLKRLQSAQRKAKAQLSASNTQIANIEKEIISKRSALEPLKAEYINGKRTYEATVIEAGSSPTASQQAKIDNEKFKFYLIERKYEKADKELSALEEKLVSLKKQKTSSNAKVISLGKNIIAQKAILNKSQDWAKQAEEKRQAKAEEEKALLQQNLAAKAEILRLKRLLAEREAAEKITLETAASTKKSDKKPSSQISEIDEVTAPSFPLSSAAKTNQKQQGNTSIATVSPQTNKPTTPNRPTKAAAPTPTPTPTPTPAPAPTKLKPSNTELVKTTNHSINSKTETKQESKALLNTPILSDDKSGLQIHRYHLRSAMKENAFPANRQPKRVLQHNPAGYKRSTASPLKPLGGNQYSTLLRLKGGEYYFRVGEYNETIAIPPAYSGRVFTIYFDGSSAGPDINIAPKAVLP